MRKGKHCKWMSILVIASLIMVMVWAASGSWAAEKEYPNRPIQAVVCYEPGSTDTVCRPFTEKLPEYIGQPMNFVFKPGGAGATGASFVAKAKPDGYTLIATSPSPVMLCPLSKDGLGYTLDDFVPISRLTISPIILAVKGDSPWKNLNDIIKEAKKSPGKLTYSTSGFLGSLHIPMEIFLRSAGITMTHVPCKGAAPAAAAILGGHVDMSSGSMATFLHHCKSGALRPIAIFDKERLKDFPDVPTFFELGYPAAFVLWYGIMAPKGTPEEVVKKIDEAFVKIYGDHKNSIEDRLSKMSMRLAFLNSREFTREVKVENEIVKKTIKDLMKEIKK